MMWQTHIVPMLLTVALWWVSTAVIARLIVGDLQRYPFLLRLFATIGAAATVTVMSGTRDATSTTTATATIIAAILMKIIRGEPPPLL